VAKYLVIEKNGPLGCPTELLFRLNGSLPTEVCVIQFLSRLLLNRNPTCPPPSVQQRANDNSSRSSTCQQSRRLRTGTKGGSWEGRFPPIKYYDRTFGTFLLQFVASTPKVIGYLMVMATVTLLEATLDDEDLIFVKFNRETLIIQERDAVKLCCIFSVNGLKQNIRRLSWSRCRWTTFRRVYSLTT
jgi:hypothetical protein